MSTDPTGKQRWRVGFYVEVEVDAYEGEAVLTANAACDWPGDWSPPRLPTTHDGVLSRQPVTARVIRSQALMVKEHRSA